MKHLEVTIDTIGHAGDGVSLLEGERIYVPLALPGETVEVEVADHHARLLRIATPSPDRVKAPCRHFGACGGCALQHWRETSYRAWKQDLSAASFIYIATADLIPGLHRQVTLTASLRQLVLLLAGIGTIAIFHHGG